MEDKATISSRPVTLKDIAGASGVSRATVSAVLHGKTWVSEATRSRVQEAMRQNGYHHQLVADSLSAHFARMIGVVIGNIHNPFNTELLASLQQTLEAAGYFVIQHTTDESFESEVKAVQALGAYELGGYVIAAVQEDRPHDHLRELVDSGKLLVAIGAIPDLETHVVDFDDQLGSRLATNHLIEHGHGRIACLAGPSTSSFAKHRIMGYIESLMRHGITVDEHLIIGAGDTLDGGYNAAREALTQRAPRPTALVCFNDLVAMGAYRAAHDLGLSIPQDLSVTGFDDCQFAPVMGPPLTTVATSPDVLGRQIAEIIMAVQESGDPPGYLHRRTQPTLVKRESVRQFR